MRTSHCAFIENRVDSCPDSDNYRCGLFYTTAVLSISVIMGVGEGEVLLETHLEALSFIYLGQAKASLMRLTSRTDVCRQ